MKRDYLRHLNEKKGFGKGLVARDIVFFPYILDYMVDSNFHCLTDSPNELQRHVKQSLQSLSAGPAPEVKVHPIAFDSIKVENLN